MGYKLITEDWDGIEICNKELYKGTNIKAVLFDMDGVILDSEKLYTKFWREAAAHYGFNMTEEMALGMRSLNRLEGMRKICEYFGEAADYDLIRLLRVKLMSIYINQNGIEPKPGIYQLLGFLKERRIDVAVATSSPIDRAREHLYRVKLMNSFDLIGSASMVAHGKPEPDLYLWTAKKLCVKPEECLVLEDSPTGLLAAYRAGCVPVMVPDLDKPNEEVKSRIYAVADDLFAVRELFDEYLD